METEDTCVDSGMDEPVGTVAAGEGVLCTNRE